MFESFPGADFGQMLERMDAKPLQNTPPTQPSPPSHNAGEEQHPTERSRLQQIYCLFIV